MVFQSKKRKEMSENSEFDDFMNEESDVVFVVEGRPIPALKSFLSDKSPVFSAMFSGNFKESEDREIVIEDTTYEAFNSFIWFLYCDHLLFDIDDDLYLIGQLYRLSDRYDVSRLADRIIDELIDRNQLNCLAFNQKCKTEEDFNMKLIKIRSIARIAFELQIIRLIENVMTFIDINFDHFLKKHNIEMNLFNDLTDGRLLDLMANKLRKAKEDKKYRPITADPNLHPKPVNYKQKMKKITETPKVDNYLFAKKSDVLFIVEGKPIPALKSILSIKSRVFSAMFSGNSRELKDKEIVIEDTTYEAFNAFIRFLYCDHLFFDFDNDFELIGQLYRLSNRYDVYRLGDRIIYELTVRNQLNWSTSVSDEEFQEKWFRIKSITRIAFESQISRLIENVLTFIDKNFDHFLKKDNKELNEMNDLTDGRLFHLMANKCRKSKEDKKLRPSTPFICY